jgi:hypothetical protein
VEILTLEKYINAGDNNITGGVNINLWKTINTGNIIYINA